MTDCSGQSRPENKTGFYSFFQKYLFSCPLVFSCLPFFRAGQIPQLLCQPIRMVGDDDVRPCLGDVQGVPEPLGIVPHHGVVVDGDAQGAETLGEDLGVGVGDVAQRGKIVCGHENRQIKPGSDFLDQLDQKPNADYSLHNIDVAGS